MSSFNRRTLLMMPLALAACGFTPVYGPGGTASALRGRVAIDAPDTQASYLLVRNLEERLGRSASPAYRLAVKPTLTQQGQAVTAAGEITRFSIVGKADFTLHRMSDDTVVAKGAVDNFTGYSATGSTVETLAAESDARERLMVILADQITTRLYTLDLPG
ncbi:LPS assembly lipoprotein LptE [Arenibacterium sp. CAU 1754]